MQQVRETSLNAYYTEVKPTLGERQKEAYNLLCGTLESLTNNEIADKLSWPINTVTPRIFELRKLNLVAEDDKRKCRITGRTALTWRIIRSTLF